MKYKSPIITLFLLYYSSLSYSSSPDNQNLTQMMPQLELERIEAKKHTQSSADKIKKIEQELSRVQNELIDLKKQQHEILTNKTPLNVVKKKNALNIISADKLMKYRLDNRIHMNLGKISGLDNNNKKNIHSGIETRRARFAIKTSLNNEWKGEIDIDFDGNEVSIKDFWVAYTGLNQFILKGGNQKVPFSIGELVSSINLTFIERALPNALVLSRKTGFTATGWGNSWYYAVGLFGDEIGKGAENGDTESSGFSGRTAVNVDAKGALLHFGIAGYRFDPDEKDEALMRARPEIHFTKTRLLNTGPIKNVSHFSNIGYEFASKIGAFIFQSEIMQMKIERNHLDAANFSGGYAQINYVFNGERSYVKSEGEFSGVRAHSSHQPAWEIALRVSRLDLSDQKVGILGGEGENTTLGINYYANNNIHFLLNFIHVTNDINADNNGKNMGNDDFNIIATQVQYNF